MAWLDDLALSCQRALDRAIRRLRRGAPPPSGERRLLIVQIDGLSRAALVVRAIAGLMRMPSAGDLVIYGDDVSFISEHGTHAGPTAAEMQTFLIGPRHARPPRGVTHPAQLYGYFLRYQRDNARAHSSPGSGA